MASAEINRQFRERGVVPIPPAEGRAYFKRELLFGPPDEVEIVAGYFEPPGAKGNPGGGMAVVRKARRWIAPVTMRYGKARSL